jgi:hypothetical protein
MNNVPKVGRTVEKPGQLLPPSITKKLKTTSIKPIEPMNLNFFMSLSK